MWGTINGDPSRIKSAFTVFIKGFLCWVSKCGFLGTLHLEALISFRSTGSEFQGVTLKKSDFFMFLFYNVINDDRFLSVVVSEEKPL